MQESSMELLWRSSHIAGGNATYVEDLYESYLKDPNGVPEQWRDYFDKLPRVESDFVHTEDIPHSVIRDRFAQISKMRVRTEATVAHDSQATEYERKQVRVVQLISAYRQRGHQKAELDPLGIAEREHVRDLELSFHELSEADYDTVFQTGSLHIGKADATLGEIHDALERTYCKSIGAEFMHIVDTDERHWIMTRMESVRSAPDFGKDVQLTLLRRLIKAEGLEKSLGSKYPGTKRFGLEGGESLIPMLAEMIQRSGSYGVQEIVIGMAHRGRLNVLINTLGKSPKDLFAEFEGQYSAESLTRSGDVKYHMGFSADIEVSSKRLHMVLAFNPSHLEIVNPVVEGSVKARQTRRSDEDGARVVPVLIHGDAAFAGQGVEVLNAAVISYAPAIYYSKIRYLVEEVGLEIFPEGIKMRRGHGCVIIPPHCILGGFVTNREFVFCRSPGVFARFDKQGTTFGHFGFATLNSLFVKAFFVPVLANVPSLDTEICQLYILMRHVNFPLTKVAHLVQKNRLEIGKTSEVGDRTARLWPTPPPPAG